MHSYHNPYYIPLYNICSTPPTKLSPRGLRPNFERELAEVWKLIFRSTLWFLLACSLVLETKAEYMLVSDGGTGFDSHLLLYHVI